MQQELKGFEKDMGKTHPQTLMTTMDTASLKMDGTKDFAKAEEMYRRALDGHEKSLGKDDGETKKCAGNLKILLENMGRLDEKAARA